MSLPKFLLLLFAATASAQIKSGGNWASGGNGSASANSTVPSWQQAIVPDICLQNGGCAYNLLGPNLILTGKSTGAVGSAVNHAYTSPLTMGLPTGWTEVAAANPIPVSVQSTTTGFLAADGSNILVIVSAGTTYSLYYSSGGTGNWTLVSGTGITSAQGLIFNTDGANCWFTTDSGKLFKSSDSHCTSFSQISLPSGTNAGLYGLLGVGAGGAPGTGNIYHLISKDVGRGFKTLWVGGEGALAEVDETFCTGTATFVSGSANVTLSAGNACLVPGMTFASDADTTPGTTITTYPGSGTALTMALPAKSSHTSVNYYAVKMYQVWLGEAVASTTSGSPTMTLSAYYPWLDGQSGLAIANGSTGTSIPGPCPTTCPTGSVAGLTVTMSNNATATQTGTYVIGTPGAILSMGGYHANLTGFDISATSIVAFRLNNSSSTAINTIPTSGTRTVTSVASPLASPDTNNLNVLHWMHDNVWYFTERNSATTAVGRFYSTDNGATWVNMDNLNGIDASCSGNSTNHTASFGNYNSNDHYVFSRCQSGKVGWVYGPI